MSDNKGFINVDQIAERVTVEQVLDHFNVPDDVRHTTAQELRTRCFLQCGKECETGDRAIAIRRDTPAKVWKCHQYDCNMSGNIISLISLALGGAARPRGKEFIEAAKVLQQIAGGASPMEQSPTGSLPPQQAKANSSPKVNTPLEEAEKEAVRAVANLYEKLTVDLSRVPPEVSTYIRKLGFLTEEVARDWGVGYLPRDAGGSTSGGTMRGKFVVPIRNRDGKVVSYMGRDCQWEQKHQAWIAGGREDKEPAKWLFPRLFHRGVEVFGQERLTSETVGQRLEGFGLPVVEGATDTIALWQMDTPNVSILSNQATDPQIERIAELAHELTDGVVTLLYDLDEPGEMGMKQDILKFSRHCKVQQGWWRGMDSRLNFNDPAQMNAEQLNVVWEHVTSRGT